jgi:hypothetical protein
MFKIQHLVLVAAVGLLLSSSSAFAGGGGGGGTKRNGTIVVINDSSGTVGVTTNSNSSAIQTALTDKSTSEFTAAGGRLVNAGSRTSFSVLAGTYTLGAADSSFDTPVTDSVTVAKGQTVYVYLNNTTPTTTGGSTIVFSTTGSTTTAGTTTAN